MQTVKQCLKSVLRKVYYRLVRPLQARMRPEMRGDMDKVWEELARMNRIYLEFHGALTQRVADEVTRISVRLEEHIRETKPPSSAAA
jgi:hypothetical protein